MVLLFLVIYWILTEASKLLTMIFIFLSPCGLGRRAQGFVGIFTLYEANEGKVRFISNGHPGCGGIWRLRSIMIVLMMEVMPEACEWI